LNKCCKGESKYQIIFDIGTDISEWTVCKKHYSEEKLFQKNIKAIKEM